MVCGGNNLSRGTSGSGNGVWFGVGDVTTVGTFWKLRMYWEHNRGCKGTSGHLSLNG